MDKPFVIPFGMPVIQGAEAYANFQKEIGDEPDANRFYMKWLAMTSQVNKNFFQVTEEALGMMAEGYRRGLPFTINHSKGAYSHDLGIGQTVSAEVSQGVLYLVSYIAKNKTYNMPTLGSSEELIAGIMDGFIRRGSTSIKPLEAECSVCGSEIDYIYYGCDEHRKGKKTAVKNAEGLDEIVTPYVIIKKAEAIEFSVVMIPADENSEVVEKNLNMFVDSFITQDEFDSIFDINNSNSGGGSPPSKTDEPEGGSIMTAAEIKALQAERDAEKTRADANQSRIDFMQQEIDAKNEELRKLRDEAVENSVLIADGKTARKEFIDSYIEEFNANEGENANPELEQQQRDLVANFSLERIKRDTESLKKLNEKLYPKGRSLDGKEPEETGDGDELLE